MPQYQLQPQLPDFNLPEKYLLDKWDIKNWDYYINSQESYRSAWRVRSGKTNHQFDFTLCKNIYIREELKYFMYYLIEYKQIKLPAFAEYYDRFKILSEYVNTYMKNNTSLLDLKDFTLFEFFLSTKKKNKVIIKNGTELIGTERKAVTRRSRFITFVGYVQRTLDNYYYSDIPEIERLIWRAEKLNCKKNISSNGKTLDFSQIANEKNRKLIQKYCLFKLESITFNAVYAILTGIRQFIIWLDEQHPDLSLNEVTREEIEEYYLWLRTKSGKSSRQLNVEILNIKCFFDWGLLFQIKGMPNKNYILEEDYDFKHTKESKYLTDAEMKAVISIIPQMPKLYGKIVYCLMFLGVRYCELSHLEITAFKQNDDGTYYLDINQYKTNKINGKPVIPNLVPIIKHEIKINKERFGTEAKYIFVTDQNKPVSRAVINRNINKLLIKNNICGSDGKILHVTTHQFRATVATNLISTGTPVDIAAQLLGQSTLSSLSHYATVTNDVVKEQLRPRLEKDEMLIKNIGKGKDMAEVIPEKSIALCNGYCNKNPLTTPCAKANACLNCSMFIPSIQFLNGYYLQLKEIEATIKIAEANNYVMLLKKAKMEKASLEKIIAKLETLGGKRDDK